MSGGNRPESDTPVFVALTAEGAALARRLQSALPGAALHGLTGRVAEADHQFEDTAAHLCALFAGARPIVGLCAAGVLIRALAPTLSGKGKEPAVVALAEDGSAAVPLLGGHCGANALARRLAALTGGTAAVTTAGDLRFGIALDAPPPGWRLANPQHHKAVAAALLGGATVRFDGELPWLGGRDLPLSEDAPLTLSASVAPQEGSPHRLVYHPQVLALGLGCERGTAPDEAIALAERCLAENDLAPGALAAVVSLDLKSDEPTILAAAAHFGVPARFFSATALEAETPRLARPSDAVFREVGCHGVAEGAALAAAGPEATLVVPKTKSARATCAVAQAPAPIDPVAIGRARGSLAVVGLGPGDPAWRAPEAETAVHRASDLVGYGLYLDLLGPLGAGKARHAFALGEEEARGRTALELAAQGRDVALVCSGDPGIYAMAALVFELIERGDDPAWARPAVTVVPGISALQAAAARAGAPLGHDFCAISLSDLLTPWPMIERRLRAAAEGDFVVALYNPVSRRRRDQLTAAARILGQRRPATTPVILARNLGRNGETVEVIRLDELSPARVDMLTIVLVGSSQTRIVPRGDGGRWVYTPRGYAAKAKSTRSAEDAA